MQLYAAGSLRAAMTEVVASLHRVGWTGGQRDLRRFRAAARADREGRSRPTSSRRPTSAIRRRSRGRAARRRRSCSRATGSARSWRRVSRRPRIRCSTGCWIRESSWARRRPRPIRPATTRGSCSRRPISFVPARIQGARCQGAEADGRARLAAASRRPIDLWRHDRGETRPTSS